MARSIETLGLRVMKAIKSEWELHPSFNDCRTVGELSGRICRSQQEHVLVLRFISDRHFIEAIQRGQSHAARPTVAGLAWIDDHKTPFTLQRLYWIIGIIGVI